MCIRDRHLTETALARTVEALRNQREALLTMDLDEEAAAELTLRHPLRPADALHLAAALEVRAEARGADLVFACYDRRLNQAARVEGLQVFGPI